MVITIFITFIFILVTCGIIATMRTDRHISKAPKGNGIGAAGSKNWVWF